MHWAAAAILTAFYGLHLPVMLAVRLSAGGLKIGAALFDGSRALRRAKKRRMRGGSGALPKKAALQIGLKLLRRTKMPLFSAGAGWAFRRRGPRRWPAERCGPSAPCWPGGRRKAGVEILPGISRPLRGGRNSAGIGGAAGGRGGSGGAIREGTYCGAAFGKKYGQKGGKAEKSWKNIPFRA